MICRRRSVTPREGFAVPRSKPKPLPTVWEVSDELWERVEPVLTETYPPKATGRPRVDFRRVLEGVIFRLRSGVQWNRLPERFGDDSSVHRWFQRWCEDGVLARVWAVLVEGCEELDAVDWEWQAADGRLGKARLGGARSARIRRTAGKTGRSRASSSRPTAARSPR